MLDADEAYAGGTLVHEAHGSNVLLDRTFVWGEVEKDFAASPHKLKHRVKWGRSSTVPIETFGVTASWDPWREILDVWASIQMPKYPDQTAMALKIPMSSVRVHYDVDVGGSYGVKRGIKHTVLVGYLSKRLGVPVRLIEDRLENMRGGDMHGPERNFDVEVAFDDQGIIRSMKMRALDNVGAYAGPLAVPARQAGRRHRRAVQDQERAVSGHRRASPTRRCRRRCAPSASRRPTTPSSAPSTRWRTGSASTGSKCAGAT